MQTKNRQVIKISKFIQKKSITRKLVRSQIYANGKGSNRNFMVVEEQQRI